MDYSNYSKTARGGSPTRSYLAYPSSPLLKVAPSNSFMSSRDTPETILLRREVGLLKRNLKNANSELNQLKINHEQEINELREAFEGMKKEVEMLRKEQKESRNMDNYGIEEYTSLAKEVIRLRTEVDRITYLYNKEKRKSAYSYVEEYV